MATRYGSNDPETLYGTAYDDYLYAYGGNDTLIGSTGYNDHWSGTGYDWISMSTRSTAAGFSNDYVRDFAFGYDKINVAAWGVSDFAQLTALLTSNANGDATFNAYYGGQNHVITIANVAVNELVASDFVFSGAGAKSETGTSAADVLFGSRSDDVLKGAGGNDNLIGGSGNDTLVGGLGADRLNGGLGIDTASYPTAAATNTSTGAGVVVDLLSPSANTGEAKGDTFVSIENLAGSAYGDSLRGNDFVNLLSGGNGNDLLYGRGGNDTLLGGDGLDDLFGNNGNDRLNGGAGGDDLYGGLGTDTLTGGSGSDAFVFTTLADSLIGNARDFITDFQDDLDVINLSALDARPDLSGNQAFVFRAMGTFTGAGQVAYYHTGGNTVISGSTDSDTTPEFQIEVAGVHYLIAGDFIL